MKPNKDVGLVELLNNYLQRVKRGQVELHDLMYVNNLIQNAMIDLYRERKITYAKLDQFLHPESDDKEY